MRTMSDMLRLGKPKLRVMSRSLHGALASVRLVTRSGDGYGSAASLGYFFAFFFVGVAAEPPMEPRYEVASVCVVAGL